MVEAHPLLFQSLESISYTNERHAWIVSFSSGAEGGSHMWIDTDYDECRTSVFIAKMLVRRFLWVDWREDQVFAMSLTWEGLKEIWMFRIASLPDVARSSTRSKRSSTIWIKEFTSSKSLEKPTGNEPIVANESTIQHFFRIDLVTVFDAILTSRQTR